MPLLVHEPRQVPRRQRVDIRGPAPQRLRRGVAQKRDGLGAQAALERLRRGVRRQVVRRLGRRTPSVLTVPSTMNWGFEQNKTIET